MAGKGPKSHKADGTPKKRWTAAERAARGHKPRRGGGQRRRDDDRRAHAAGRKAGPHEERPFHERYDAAKDHDQRDSRTEAQERRTYAEERRRYADERKSGADRRGVKRASRHHGDADSFDNSRPTSQDRPRRQRDERPGKKPTGRYARAASGNRWDNADDRTARRDRGRPYEARDDKRRDERSQRAQREEQRSERPRRDVPDQRRSDRHERRHQDGRRGEQRGSWDRGEAERRRGPREDERRHRGPQRDHRRDEAERGPAGEDAMSWSPQEIQPVTAAADSGFLALGVEPQIVDVLAAQGITQPFPIQQATIADALAGRDVLGRGRTGSGKTLAFGLPLLTRLHNADPTGGPRAVILSPTRELAMQIADNLSPLAAAVGLHLTLVAGGMSYGPQIRAFERGVDVVVATPGRLIDLVEQGVADLSGVEIMVLDEADHMSDLGFLPDVTTILDAAGDGQRLLFSATLDGAVATLVEKYLTDPVTHEVDDATKTVTTMTHYLLQLQPHLKNQATAEIANRDGRTIIFARTQMGAERIATQLREAGVMAGALHGGMTQGARARMLDAFRNEDVPVLVATDVAARGIHVDDVSLVLQVDPPRDSKDYLHRAGRTARAGDAGTVVTIVLPHQRKTMRRITGQAHVKAAQISAEPGSDELAELTGAQPTNGGPISEAAFKQLVAPKQPQRKSRPRRGWGRRR